MPLLGQLKIITYQSKLTLKKVEETTRVKKVNVDGKKVRVAVLENFCG